MLTGGAQTGSSMSRLHLYVHPTCSKCRSARALLDAATSGLEYEVIDYLATPLRRSELEALAEAIGDGDQQEGSRLMLRDKDLARDRRAATADERLDALVADPKLLERPILRFGSKAIIARPPELVLEFVASLGSQST